MKTIITWVFGLSLAACLIIPFILYGAWAGAFVGVKLWAWFIVPIFGFKMLTLAQAFGIALLIGFWTKQQHTNVCKDERSTTEKVTEMASKLFYPWLVLLIGYICKSIWL